MDVDRLLVGGIIGPMAIVDLGCDLRQELLDGFELRAARVRAVRYDDRANQECIRTDSGACS